MKIRRFFIIYTVMLFLELIMFGVFNHPTIPLVKLAALAALASHQLPWYATVYLLAGVSFSSFMQGLWLPADLIGMSLVIIALATYLQNLLINHLIAQSLLVAFFGLFFMALDCHDCLTISNILFTILISPIMLQFLR